MDVFTLNDDGISTYTNGEIINGLTNKLWIERYRECGEFKFVCTPSDYILGMLPLGTLISHTNAETIMMVEDHEIVEERGSVPVLTITGRSIDGFFHNRVATDDDLGFSPALYDGTAWPYTFQDVTSYEHCVELIKAQIEAPPVRAVLAIPFVDVRHEVYDISEVPENREAKRDSLYTQVIDILAEIDAGLKIQRPVQGVHAKIRFVVHDGIKRTDTVNFSYEAGDLDSAKYFWSLRSSKNTAYISGMYHGYYVPRGGSEGASGFNRRVMYIDATDFKAKYGTPGWDGANAMDRIEKILLTRARKILGRRKTRELVEANVAKANRYTFRKDYNIGDTVYVTGNYGLSAPFRVTEYAEIEDESGESGYPTLGIIN
jgi:Siphovirus ReqiPepy6 Gp37-like protein